MAPIKKYYNFKIIRYYGIKNIIKKIIEEKKSLLYLSIIIIFIISITNVIIDIDILTNNKEIYNIIDNELYRLNIKKFTFKKNDSQLLEIKNKILKNQSNKIEWLNIEKVGMKYIINVEPKKNYDKQEKNEYCHIISNKDATITRIITSQGTELKEINDSIKKGEIIISGDIIYNDEIKQQVCANGEVYGKTWYTINLSIPKKKIINKKLNQKRYNIILKYNNKSYQLFNPRLKNYTSSKKKIISIFGLDIYLQTDVETKETTKIYTEKELEKEINKLVEEKMNKILKGESKIYEQKVLKKQYNNSTIDIEIFIVAEELISKTQIINKAT